jgi:uncharacterized membrane-anchored protein YjiN (DUF445 family)
MAEQVSAPPLPSEEGKRRELRRMKAGATLLLVAFAVMYAIATRWQQHGAPGWVGYWATATEAGMVGALADWFAVTALFRRPLGLPIPHTAIIPTRKDALGRSLQAFVADNFLSGDVVRDRVSRAGIPLRVGTWLSTRRSADRVVGEAATAMRAVVEVLHDDDVQEVLEHSLVRRLLEPPWGPPAGQLLDRIVQDGTHHKLVDLAIDETHRWLLDNDEIVLRVVRDQAPTWTPAFVDTAIALRVYTELVRFVGEVRVDPDHRSRQAVDAFLTKFADDLQHNPDTIAAAEQAKQRVLEHPEFRKALIALWSSVKTVLLAAADDPDSELRQRASLGLMSLGERIVADEGLRTKLDGWIGDALTHVVTTYRDEVATVISDTVGRWDADETSRRIEIQVGRDLQYIRINGTLVGALAGLAIHAITVAAF